MMSDYIVFWGKKYISFSTKNENPPMLWCQLGKEGSIVKSETTPGEIRKSVEKCTSEIRCFPGYNHLYFPLVGR